MNTTKPVKKVSDLSGPALDWAVAKCEHPDVVLLGRSVHVQVPRRGMKTNYEKREYSSNWSLAGPIIERERIDVAASESGDEWNAQRRFSRLRDDEYWSGPTPLIAAMRCYVASKLGDTVEIPEELL